MRRGVIAGLRDMRRWLAQAVALVLILPALLAILPQPALSAAAALDHDLMTSVCGQDGAQQQEGGPRRHTAHDHCVLCGSNCPSCSPSLATAAAAFAPRPRGSLAPAASAAPAIAPPLQALLDASPPRGPPACG